jgi:8-oxo-dGTP diphosphatase
LNNLSRFNIRIYGILISCGYILLSHEYLRGVAFTKFPGGGLNLGEAPSECLKREFQEELGLPVQVDMLLNVPDFVVVNRFQPEEQVLVLHYQVSAIDNHSLESLNLGNKTLESLAEPNHIHHSWELLETLTPEQLTFPADKAAVRELKSS